MNLIFLDIDGVLATRATRYRTADPPCVAALNRIILTCNAAIVVSSCWRLGCNVVELRELLGGWGVIGTVVGRTADLLEERGHEIATWLESYPREVCRFVILDDDKDMAHLLHCLVQTDTAIGLTEADADQAILMLNGA